MPLLRSLHCSMRSRGNNRNRTKYWDDFRVCYRHRRKIVRREAENWLAIANNLIRKLKKDIQENNSIVILDSPPGNNCKVVETVSDADFVVLVTEPTPFGLHDLKITIELMDQLDKPFGVVVNKAGLGKSDIYQFLKEKSIDLIGEVPFMKTYSQNYFSGKLLQDIPEEIENAYLNILQKLNRRIGN